MSLFLSNLKKLHSKKVIDLEQLVFLTFADSEIVFNITAPRLKKLVTLGYIKSGKVDKSLYKELENVKARGTIAPIYTTDLSKDVVKHICRHVCVKDGDTIAIPGSKKEPLTYTASTYLNGEHALAYPYLIFLFLFPSEKAPNKRWENHFLGTKYTGMPLRIRSVTTGKAFIKMAKNKDMGAFMLGAYRFIKSSIKGDKAFITTIPKYFKMFEDGYEIALEDISNAESIEDLFRTTGEDTGLLNVVL